ncbi:MAG TPA: 50S ribosomal protein L18 [Candidatus Bilamarchaeaceae archaeon]|nr:50S ribosomal protein L18 [Candidatus Bilamarchaeaceae archaeon]
MARAKGPKYEAPFRRRRENVTNYAKRLALVKGGLPRMVVRKGSTSLVVQFVEYTPTGDKVIAGISSNALGKFKWAPRANLPTAYLTGLYAGRLAKKKGVKEFVLDTGLYPPVKGSLLFAAQKGAMDSGLGSPHGEGLVDEGRITGSHIEEYAKSLGDDDYKRRFSSYLKDGFKPREFTSHFSSAKEAILKEA